MMTAMTANSTAVLNELLSCLYRSLPMYLADADPWMHRGDARAKAVFDQIVEDQKRDCSRLAELILDHDATIDLGEFPMEYTDLNFLSLDFLLQELLRCQSRDLARIDQCVAALSNDPAARQLAEEIKGTARAHLELLQELVRAPAKS